MTKTKLVNLVSLDLELYFELHASDIENLAESFGNIKSLALYFVRKDSLKAVSKVFEKFNRLESLKLWSEKRLRGKDGTEVFYNAQNHRNPHLKSLSFKINCCKLGNELILKFTRDFPNLETIGFYEKVCKKEHFEQLMMGFEKLKKIDDLWIDNDELLNAFLQHRQKLEEFHIDISTLEDPNEVLKGYSIKFEPDFNKHQLTKSSGQANEVDFLEYSQCQKIHTMMASTKQTKHLTVFLCIFSRNVDIKGIVRFLSVTGESVTKLTLQHVRSSTALKEIIDSVPNIESLTLEDPQMCRESTEDVKACYFSQKLTSFSVGGYAKIYYDDEFIKKVYQNLSSALKFADDSLVSFALTNRSQAIKQREMILQAFEKILENQKKLTKNSEDIDGDRCTVKFTAE